MCRPESCGVADWAARRLYEIMLRPVWEGQPGEGQALPCQAMATTRINDSKWSFSRQDENIITPTPHKSWINWNICKGDGWRMRNINVFKAESFTHEEGQDKGRYFLLFSNKRTISRPGLQKSIEFCRGKTLGSLWKKYVTTFGGELREQRRNCGETTLVIMRLRVQHVVETPFRAIAIGFLPSIYGGRFHQDISQMDIRCSGKCHRIMLADYCWTLVRKTPTEEYKTAKTTEWLSHGIFIYFYWVCCK